jgi:hypothetical protein
MLIVLSDEKFEEFISIIESPPRDLGKLRALLTKESPFESGVEYDCG